MVLLWIVHGFEPYNNFEALNSTQQSAVRSSLAMDASVTNLNFVEISETSTQHADLRYAESDTPSTAWTYYPSTAPKGGDSWFNNSKNKYDSPYEGNYAYHIFDHELGHALGLKHPHEAIGSFAAMPVDRDALEYTVMSYRSYIGASTTTGYTNETWSYPQSLMIYDIAALQRLYGADFTTRNGDTVYSWTPTTGEEFINGVGQGAPGGNRIFLTVWDGGGRDTYDFSNYGTDLKVDLNPGEWTTTSSAQLAELDRFHPGAHLAAGNIANALLNNNNSVSLIENAKGGPGADTIIGNLAGNTLWGNAGDDELYGSAGNDILTGGSGADVLDGGDGLDVAMFTGLSAEHSWAQSTDGTWTVHDLRSGNPDGTDSLTSIEILQFDDTAVSVGTTPPMTTDLILA